MTDDLISIILPVYNSENSLERTLRSLKQQTYKNIEILCINDGSTDHSLDILRSYVVEDSRFRIFDQKNSGAGVARNTGLANMRGKYLMFCDSDDYYEPEMCEEMLKAMQKTNADFIVCKILLFIEQVSRHSIMTYDYFKYSFREGMVFLDAQTRSTVDVALWNKIFKVDKIRKYNISFPEIYNADDIAFILQYICCSSVYYGLNKELYRYTTREGSIMDNEYKQLNSNSKSLFQAYYAFEGVKSASLAIRDKNILDQTGDALLIYLNILIKWLPFFYKGLSNERWDINFDEVHNILSIFNEKRIKNFPLLYLISKKRYRLARFVLGNTLPVKILRRLRRLIGQWKNALSAPVV